MTDHRDLLGILRTGTPVVCGTSRIEEGPADAILDAFVEGGGTAFDAAAVYQHGEAERILGDWLRRRKNRDRMTLITKGAHPGDDWLARLTPKDVRDDLHDSLRRLGTDVVDVYLLHRDDESQPVAALTEILVELRESGLVKWTGVSNWRTPRLRQALDMGAPIDIVSNHFGLGIPSGPPLLPGVVSSFDREGHDLFATAGLPLLAWSARSGGFFAEPMRPARLPEECAANPESMRRRRVLREVAADHGHDPDAVHMRWLVTSARHLIPVVSSGSPPRIASLMAAAADRSLDDAVADLVRRIAANGTDASPLLLPDSLPEW